MRWWKLLGVAAFVGVAATGVVVARAERRQHDYTPDEIRERLRARAAEAFGGEIPADLESVPPQEAGPTGATPTVAPDGTGAPPAPPEAPEAAGEAAAASSPAARLAVARRRVVAGVAHARTRLGLRPPPTRRRTSTRR